MLARPGPENLGPVSISDPARNTRPRAILQLTPSSGVLLEDPESLSAGKTIYTTQCAVCHRPDGGGSIGPNLTDPYWVLGGDIQSIFSTVSEGGRPGKGMIAWKSTLRPQEIQQVSSYIISLAGTKPENPKAPEGTNVP